MKFGKYFKNYIMITQGIFAIIGYSILGLIIGLAIDKESLWPAILTIIGLIMGLISFVMCIIKFIKLQNKIEDEGGEISEETKS